MIRAGEEALEAISGVSLEDFRTDRLRQKAVIRNLEVLGEAARQLPDGWRAVAGDVPWRSIIAMRHRLAHGYFGVDVAVVHETVKLRVPELLPVLRRLLADLEQEGPGIDG